MYKVGVIIPAAGSGKRMGAPVPKPFIDIQGKSIIEYTVAGFIGLPFVERIIIPVSGEWLKRTRRLFAGKKTSSNTEIICIEGGRERQDSVSNALIKLAGVDLVAVHDAVRPLVSEQTIRACCDTAYSKGAAVAGTPVRDTLKKVDASGSIRATTDRSGLWQAHTPQVFQFDLYRKAVEYAEENNLNVTDDAGLVQAMKKPVFMVKDESINIKLTYPEDLAIIRAILTYREGNRDI